MDPYLFTHALLQDVIARGGHVFDRTPVEKHHRERNGNYVLRTVSGHRIIAAHLVMATGYASQQLLPKAVMDLDSTYAVAGQRMEIQEMWPGECLIWETACLICTCAPHPTGG